MTIPFFDLLDFAGTVAFAVSGALTAMNKRLDAFGVFIICFVTAVGGGTLRDVLIGKTPVMWMHNLIYVYIVIASFFITIFFRKKLDGLRKSMLFFDTIGLGIFTIIGIEKGLAIDLNPIICIALGTITASFGGVIRDILCNEIPAIFREEIYATACVFGGILFFMMYFLNVPQHVNVVVTSLVIIAVRFLSIKFKWSLPKFKPNN